MSKKKIRAVLFDYDGVLADTIPDNFRAWEYAFAQYNIDITLEDYTFREGLSPVMITDGIATKYGLDRQYFPNVVLTKQAYYKNNNNFRLYPGVEDVINELKKAGIKIAIVSGAAEKQIRSVVSPSFLSRFDVFISSDHIKNPKPNPEPYLKALELLNIFAQEAIVIENAPLGITAAKKAGIYCIAICSTLPKDFLSKADIIIDKFGDLSKTLQKVIKER